MKYIHDLSLIEASQLEGFFVGWPKAPDSKTHLKILQGSYRVWLAIDKGRCVGFINAISDGVFYAYIPLLEVLPSYQSKGVGAELVKRMCQSLAHLYAIDLVCDDDVVSFYEKQAFQKGTAMLKRNYANQQGNT